MPDSHQQLSKTTVFLHWLVAITMIGMIGVGKYMHDQGAHDLYPTHKSIGMLILAVIIIRVIWRFKNGWPKPLGQYSKIEQVLSKLVHWVLIIGTVLFPLSGMMMSHAGGHGLYIFGMELAAANYNEAGKVVEVNALGAEIGHIIHGVLGKVIIVAIVLHIVGSLKHHFRDKDGTLRRMLGKRV